MTKFSIGFITLFFATGLAQASRFIPDFQFTKIDRAAKGARKIGVSIDGQNKLHVAYTGCSDDLCKSNELFYALKDQVGWRTQMVDNAQADSGWFPTLEVSQAGIPFVFYANHAKHQLKLATVKSGKWSLTNLSKNKWGGWWNSSAKNGDRIVFAHTKFPENHLNASVLELGSLKMSDASGPSAEMMTISNSTETGWNPSVAMNATGDMAVSYLDLTGYPFGNLSVSYFRQGELVTEEIDGPALKSSLVVDPMGFFHVIYQVMVAGGTNGNTDLKYATNFPDGNWHKSYVDQEGSNGGDTGLHPYLVMDVKGGLHAFYRNYISNEMKYARKLGSSDWEVMTIDDQGQSGFYPVAAFDSSNRLHLMFLRSEKLFHGVCTNCVGGQVTF